MDIKNIRESLMITQYDVSKKLNCTIASISKIENYKMSKSLTDKYKEFLLFEKSLFISNKLNKLAESIDCIEIVKPRISGCKTAFTFDVITSFDVVQIKYDSFEKVFYVTHLPKDVSKSILIDETRLAVKIVKLFNKCIDEKNI